MNAYLDSSVLLRIVLGQRDRLKEWRTVQVGVASALVEVECLRTLDRLRLADGIAAEEIARRRETVYQILESLTLVELTRSVLARAAQPLPVVLGTLDALHLATALLWREQTGEDLFLATHDTALGLAARSVGFRVLGL